MSENSFLTTREKWDKLPSAEKTWAKWKAQAGGGSFGSTNTATAFHGISALDPANDKVPSSTVKNIDGYLDNIAAEATKKRDVLNLLMANNKRLNTTNVTSLTEIKNLLTNRENVHANRCQGW